MKARPLPVSWSPKSRRRAKPGFSAQVNQRARVTEPDLGRGEAANWR